MKALYFDSKKLELVQRRKPARRPGEALVRVRMAGICATDMEILKGYMNFRGTPGHEFVGEVAAPEESALYGKRVVGEINIACRKCTMCKAGLYKHCPNRKVLGIDGKDGAFAEYLTLPLTNLHEVPDSVTDEEAIFVEPLAAACEFLERETITKRENVLVLGDGKLAALVAQVIYMKTKKVTVLGRSDAKLAFFKKLGIRVLNISSESKNAGSGGGSNRKIAPIEERYNLPGELFDIVIECSGSPDGLPIAARLVMPRGRIILKSTYRNNLKWNPSQVVINEVSIIGSRCGPFDTAVEIIKSGEVTLRPLISAVYPLEEWRVAFKKAGERDTFKVALRLHQ